MTSGPANGGFLVQVGCAQFAYTEEDKLIQDLAEYIRNPVEVEKQYNKHYKAYDEEPIRGRPVAPRSLGEMVPESETNTEGQTEATDPAADIESSGY